MRISDWSSDVCSSDLIRRHARGDLGRAVFLEETGGEAEQVALDRLADVGDGAFAEPAHEIEAQRGREREGDDYHVEQAEMRRDIAAAGDEAAVDHRLDLPGDRQSRQPRDAARTRPDTPTPEGQRGGKRG